MAASLHWLPCTIAHSGPAEVDKRFQPEQAPEGAPGEVQATFRGRRLRGRPCPLPTGYAAVVLAKKPATGCAEPHWQVQQRAHSLTYWNHDLALAATDSQPRALQWLEVAAQARLQECPSLLNE